MKKVAVALLGSALALGTVACDNARTSADAPSDLTESVDEPAQVEETLEDADSEVRQAQLDSDIRAREERNEVLGDETVRNDSDIESQVRAKLEANIPRSKLTIAAADGAVTIVGSVPSEREYETIKPLAQEILGVDSVEMDVEIVPAAE
ncbi:MAG: BON domain-containing protein [Phormidesmis sp.]